MTAKGRKIPQIETWNRRSWRKSWGRKIKPKDHNVETINSGNRVMLIFQSLYLFSFIKNCSKNFSFITESNKVLKSGIQTTFHQEEKKKNMPTFQMWANTSFCEVFILLSSTKRSSQLFQGFLKMGGLQSEFLKHCWDSVGQARTAHPPKMGARAHPPNAHSTPCQGRQHWLLKTLVSQLRHQKEPERVDFSCALCSPGRFCRNI